MDEYHAHVPRHLHADCLLSLALEAAPDAIDDFDWDYVSPDGLHLREAFGLATTWASRLQRLVRVLGTPSSSEMVANQEWIDIQSIDDDFEAGWVDDEINDDEDLMNERVAIAAMARATMLLWQALATCRGFTIKQNDGFWRRVFDHLHCVPLTKAGDASNIELWHTVKLFEGVAFPRCRVHIPATRKHGAATGAILRTLAGLESYDSASPVTKELETALVSLAPFVQVDQLEPVDIMVDFSRGFVPDEVGVIQLLDTVHAIEKAHETHVTRDGSTVMQHLAAQPWTVQLCMSSSLFRLSDALRHCALPLHESARIPWGSLAVPYATHAVRLQFMAYVRWVLGLSAHGGGAQRLDFTEFSKAMDAMACVCSGLPFTTCVTKVDLQRDHHGGLANVIGSVDLAWLSFALFHPDSNASTWRSLGIGVTYNELKDWSAKEVIAMMATGNNLRVIMGITTETADRYFTARLRAGAVIYAAAKKNEAIVTSIEEEDAEMDVCVTTSDVAAVGDWVMVVMPGFGAAYVESSFIESITARAPGKAFLSHLALKWVNFARPLIELAGGELEYVKYQNMCSGDDRRDGIHTACPKLVAYHLHAGSLVDWTLPASLRELHIVVFGFDLGEWQAKLALFQSLEHLETLVITAGLTPFLEDIEGFVLPLLRSMRHLKRFHWRSGSRGSTPLKSSYAQKRLVSRLLIRGLVTGRDDVAIVPASVTALVALLSVVQSYARADPVTALGSVGKDVVALIGSFLGTTVKRDLYIEARRRWIRPGPPIVEPPMVDEPFTWGDY